tara:strand:+ start:17073 stop:17966 length:894 start_codon:yes stop_codon:yes gene_type:complete
MKGIVLAGGSNSRLYPLTLSVSKHLLPVYDKPMIYYPISVLMLAGIRDILLITNPDNEQQYSKLLGSGESFGINISYASQEKPEGIAQAFLIGENFIGNDTVSLILGDNIFFGQSFGKMLRKSSSLTEGAYIFGYPVRDPERFGVVEIDSDGKAISLEEKPEKPKTNFAATGLYFYDNNVVDITKDIKPSDRGELEITDVNLEYLKMSKLNVQILGRGFAWLDTGTHQSLLEASSFVKTLEERQGIMISCLEEIAFGKGWIDEEIILERADSMGNSPYSQYLKSLLNQQTKFPWDSK